MQSWKTLTRKTILNHGKFLAVEDHSVELPNGRIIHDWPWVITPSYVNVVAVTEEDRFLCFRQTKYGISGISLAIVGGYIEPGEDPLAAAQRELLEETGHEAPEWLSLGSYVVDANRGAGVAHLFLAHRARRVGECASDDLEEQETALLTYAEMEEALAANAFKVLPWATAAALALKALPERQSGKGQGRLV